MLDQRKTTFNDSYNHKDVFSKFKEDVNMAVARGKMHQVDAMHHIHTIERMHDDNKHEEAHLYMAKKAQEFGFNRYNYTSAGVISHKLK